MSTPTRIGDVLAERVEQIKANRSAPEPQLVRECIDHPGNDCLNCQPCQARRVEQDRERIAKEGEDRCWKEFPLRYSEADTDRPDVIAWAERFDDDAPSLLLLGPTGTGKTYQAYAALRRIACTPILARVGYRAPSWRAMTYADFCASLRPRGSGYDPEATLERYINLDMVMIDDLGAAKVSEFAEEATYRLINGRYNAMKPAIYTSNLALPELKAAIGDRIASRLAEDCVRVVLDGPDRRRTQTPAQERR